MRNQEIKADDGKLRMELIPPETLISLAEVLTYGANKYSANSWQQVEPERYTGALLRHFIAYMRDSNSVDEESGIKHIKHVLCNAMFLNWFERDEIQGVDWLDVINKQATEIAYLKEHIERLENI